MSIEKENHPIWIVAAGCFGFVAGGLSACAYFKRNEIHRGLEHAHAHVTERISEVEDRAFNDLIKVSTDIHKRVDTGIAGVESEVKKLREIIVGRHEKHN